MTNRDLLRVKLRALYEVAEVNLEARRLLNHMLEESDATVDRFLEILGSERYNPQFATEALPPRLYKSISSVYARLESILRDSQPPFPVGRFISAFIQVAPRLFVAYSVDLLRRFASSRQDTEEICIGILMAGVEPSGGGELFAFYRTGEFSLNTRLVQEVFQLLRDMAAREELSYLTSTQAVPKLWARLQRSGSFGNSLDMALKSFKGKAIDPDQLRAHVISLLKSWRSEVSPLVSTVESSPIWNRLSSRHMELAGAVARMDRSMARLGLIEGLDTADDKQADEASVQMAATTLELKEAIDQVSGILYGFFVNLSRCSVWRIGETVKAIDGSELQMLKEIDQSVPLVFCCLEELDSAVGEIIENWRKHKTAAKSGSQVWAKLFLDDGVIVMELGDNIDGEFRMESEGGLRVVREFCEGYGIRLAVKHGAEFKMLRLSFVAIDVPKEPEEFLNA